METIARNIRVTAIATAAALAMAYCLFAETMYFAFPVQAQEVSDSLSFDEAVEAFYSGSEDMTDEQILQAARDIKSDVNALYSVLGEKEAAKVEAALNAYEASKVEYMTDVINSEDDGRKSEQPGGTQGQPSGGTATQPGETQGQPSDGSQGASAGSTEELPADDPAGIVSEWLRQSRYTQLMITEGSVIREMIPRFKVTSCTMEEKILKAGIEEWMTQAYGARDGSGAVNASAYSYTFSLSLARGENGTWTPCEVNGTQINYQWLQDASDREQEAGEKKTPDPASGTGQEGTPGPASGTGQEGTPDPASGTGQAQSQDPYPERGEVPATLYAVRSDADAQILSYAKIVTDTDPEASSSSEAGAYANGFAQIPAGAVIGFSVEETGAAGVGEPVSSAFSEEDGAAMIRTASKTYKYSPQKAASYADKYWNKYFDKNTMVRAAGWKTIDGNRCYFDSAGVLKKGKHG